MCEGGCGFSYTYHITGNERLQTLLRDASGIVAAALQYAALPSLLLAS